MKTLIFIKGKAEQACAIIAGLLILMMSAIGVWQVFSRYILNSPSTNTEELLRYLMIWMGFLGAAYCFGTNSHLSLTLLENKLKSSSYFILKIIQLFTVTLTLSVALVYGGYYFVIESISQTSSSLNVSMALIYLIIPLSGIFMIIFNICNIILLISERGVE